MTSERVRAAVAGLVGGSSIATLAAGTAAPGKEIWTDVTSHVVWIKQTMRG
ncbi:hypothetical protein EV193_101833 [Herbihabitans rhizosphaerae]|uniref:Uncharacterized protein n=1 Tax=Herbihabitans rhizosphaerae TaxID=1872711 RepID=A0A4Q7L955_9PSEU|nr:hypothetical protein [Herbihabitans rhizosphaerae]RZS44952.1 hypothetical protein EV193_101833 [Herbihabitans rhizosphaerae]